MKMVGIICDRCGKEFAPYGKRLFHLMDVLESYANVCKWVCAGDKTHYCPKCAKRLKESENA
jgi:hypothetical protein